MRRWTHEVSADWLKARQAVLTATDVAGLMPEYKRYLKAHDPGKISPGFAALWAQKHSTGEPDISSPSPAAARGHVMEPWAVSSWNDQNEKQFYHWDDCIICNGIFGFSPDAMDSPQMTVDVTIESRIMETVEIMEVKSYETPKHMKSVIMDKMDHEELMQLAMAFVVLPTLERATILWFCPDAPISMHAETYTRDELHDQIRWIIEIGEVYINQSKLCEKLASSHSLKALCTELQVWEQFVKEQATDVDSIFMLK